MPFIIGIVLVLIDQITKFFTVKYLKPIDRFEIIKNFFSLDYVENRGAAFGSFSGYGVVLIIFTVIVIIGLIVIYRRIDRTTVLGKTVSVGITLMVSGAVGNLIDRAFRGYVVDMLHFTFFGYSFAVFNFADILVVCSSFMLAVCAMLYETREKKTDTEEVK